MKKQNIKISYFLLSLILFFQTNFCALSVKAQEESLYKRLGGVYNIAAVVDDFVDKLLSDPVVTANKNVVSAIGKITKPGLKYQITELLCQSAGGPQKYNGRSMKESHQGLNITEAEWQAIVKDFLAALAKFNIKGLEQNELLVIVGSTKGDILVSAPPVVPNPQPQVPAPDKVIPSAPLPQKPPVVFPAPSPANLPLPQAPVIPTVPVLPNPAAALPQIPAIPLPPNPANVVQPVPELPSLPANIPAPPEPDMVLPALPQVPEVDPPPDVIPQAQPQTETLPSAAPQEAPAPKINDELPPEPILEPAD